MYFNNKKLLSLKLDLVVIYLINFYNIDQFETWFNQIKDSMFFPFFSNITQQYKYMF